MHASIRHLSAALIALTALAAAGSAAAEECTTDADCGVGFACQLTGATACAEPACPPGEPCPEPAPCETEEFYECVPVPVECASDADCGEGSVCESYTYEECSGGGAIPGIPCEEGGDCTDTPAPPEDADCTTVTESYCIPQYAAGCEIDADCGAGFTCTEMEMCSCGGSGGSDGGVPGTDTPPVPGEGSGSSSDPSETPTEPVDDCVCEPSGEFYCELIPVECTADTDCTDGFICQESYETDVACAQDPESGEVICPEPEPATRYCVPENYEAWYGNGGVPGGEAFPTADGAPRDNVGEEAESGAGAGGDNDASADEPTDEDGGCAATGTSSAAPLWLAAIGALLIRRRRSA